MLRAVNLHDMPGSSTAASAAVLHVTLQASSHTAHQRMFDAVRHQAAPSHDIDKEHQV
jgi:hypothetical protein